MSLRIGLAGAGFMGSVHADAWRQIDDAEICAVCDPRLPPGTVNEVGEEALAYLSNRGALPSLPPQTRFFHDFSRFLSYAKIDIVDICTPTDLHESLTIKALEAGFPVFCEKPMALTVDGAHRMIESKDKYQQPLGIGQCLRFWPAYVEAKRFVDENVYGAVLFARFERYSAPPPWSIENWMMSKKRSGGALLDLHIHDVDLVHYIFGWPDSVTSLGITGGESAGLGVRHINTVYGFDGPIVESAGGWSVTDSYGFRMEMLIGFEKATVRYDSKADGALMVYPESGDAFSPALDERDGYYHELADFAREVEEGESSGIVTPESAARSVELALLEERSVLEKRILMTT